MKSSDRKFWDIRYRAGKMPWDFGGVPGALNTYLETAKPGRVLIPGCGAGYEARTFHDRGCDVLAIDYSTAAIECARQVLGPLADKTLLADFFTHDFGERKFDVIYERTFFCSLPPDHWPAYALRMAELLRPGGTLIGFFLYGHEEEPPPYPLTEEIARQLFGRDFTRVADEPVTDSLPLFAGRERWQVWELRS
jgi:SAM-dependent methyltransferase